MLVETRTVTEAWTLHIPGRVFTLNGERKMGRHERARRVREWREAGWAEALRAKLPKRLAAVRITATPLLATRRAQDVGGCFPVAKAVIDGLVDAGVLVEDGPKVVRALTFGAARYGEGDALELKVEVA